MHIRLDINSAVSYEKGILNAKQSLIKILQQIKKYRASREEELDKKAQVRDILKTVHVILGKLEREDLPKMKQEEKTKALRAEKKVEKEEVPAMETPMIEIPVIETQKIEEHKPSSLEKELMDIKKRLESINTLQAVSEMAGQA